VKNLNKSRFKTREEAVDTIKLHSTKNGKRVIQVKKSSGQHKVIFRCDRANGGGDERFQCGYKCVLRRTKSKKILSLSWYISSLVPHSENCLSKARITLREARNNTINNRTHLQSADSIKNTKNRIADAVKISNGSISTHVANQLRLLHANQSNELYDYNWTKLETWGEEFEEMNPGSKFYIQVDGNNHFIRMFVGLRPNVLIALKTGIDFSGIDATFFTHFIFYLGTLLILCTRDGNNKTLVLAWCVCVQENGANYHYFAKMCATVEGLEVYLTRATHILYSDRHKGIPYFERYFSGGGFANCLKHLMENCRDAMKKIPQAHKDLGQTWADQVHR